MHLRQRLAARAVQVQLALAAWLLSY